MTSNMGSELILENFEDLEAVGDKHRSEIIETTRIEVFEKLKSTLRPEFLNRIDDKIMFLPLTREEIKKIGKLQLKGLIKNLKEQGVEFEVTDKGLDLLADLGFEPQFGARPLKRVIQKEVVNELAKMLLSGEIDKAEKIILDADQKGFTFNGKSTGALDKQDADRIKKLNELTKATEALEKEIKKQKPPKPEELN